MEVKTNKATPFQVSEDALNRLSLLKESEKGKYFRVYVTGGGCSGFKYNFSFDNKINNEDVLFGKAVIDNTSLNIISGSTIDFKKEMIGESFVIKNPKATASCGCGLSFSV